MKYLLLLCTSFALSFSAYAQNENNQLSQNTSNQSKGRPSIGLLCNPFALSLLNASNYENLFGLNVKCPLSNGMKLRFELQKTSAPISTKLGYSRFADSTLIYRLNVRTSRAIGFAIGTEFSNYEKKNRWYYGILLSGATRTDRSELVASSLVASNDDVFLYTSSQDNYTKYEETYAVGSSKSNYLKQRRSIAFGLQIPAGYHVELNQYFSFDFEAVISTAFLSESQDYESTDGQAKWGKGVTVFNFDFIPARVYLNLRW